MRFEVRGFNPKLETGLIMELLRTVHNRGYPQEYLQARIRGRRAYQIGDWERILSAADPLEAVPASPYRGALTVRSEEEVWQNLLRELVWLYCQMDQRVREIFSPVFVCFELRTLVLCLRNKGERNDRKIEELLFYSLLAGKVQKALKADQDLPGVIDAVAGVLSAGAMRFGRLRNIYREQGLTGFEQGLTNLSLGEVIKGPLHPLIREFISRLIDTRNVMTLYKHLRWRIKAPPAFIEGGGIRESALREIAEKNDMAEVSPLIRRLTGEEVEAASAGNVERLLLTAITRLVRRRGREPAGTGLILDHLWRCYVEALNLSLLIHCRDDREAVRRELVQ
ncbi:MAG: hypothetical protein FD174_3867 [Geobacteraceae bacterium]|nr:MAG: hypothetical protein FD174_3867 [Geobacteraceae bacterium]